MPAIKPIRHARLARIFELDGWMYDRIKGDHLIYLKPGVKRPIVIPKWDEVPTFIIMNNLRTAGMSRERYFELLQRA
jgi:predicted RNA binding protein YcfA (HicA-like mRNA interferase family)